MSEMVQVTEQFTGHGRLTTPTLNHMELATTPSALSLLTTLHLLPSPPPNSSLLDLGSGGGCVLKCFSDNWTGEGGGLKRVVWSDRYESLREFGRGRLEGRKGLEGVEFEVMPAQDLSKIEPESFSHVTFNFGPFLLPHPEDLKCLDEVHRILSPSGHFGFTTWSNAAHSPSSPLRPIPPIQTPWLSHSFLHSTLPAHGFTDIVIQTLEYEAEHELKGYVEMLKVIGEGMWAGEGGLGRKVERGFKEMEEREGEGGKVRLAYEVLMVTCRKA